jgi:hypothetical protein
MLLWKMDRAGIVVSRIGGASVVALACLLVAPRVSAQGEPAVAVADSGKAESPSAKSADSVIAAERVWLSKKLAKVTNVPTTLQINERLGGTGPAPARTWVSKVSLDRCMMTLDRVYEAMVDGSTYRARSHDFIPLDRVNVQSIAVQQQPLDPGAVPISSKPWRVVFALTDGSIRSDFDGVTGERSSRNVTALEVLMSNRDAGLEVASHLQTVVQACQ